MKKREPHQTRVQVIETFSACIVVSSIQNKYIKPQHHFSEMQAFDPQVQAKSISELEHPGRTHVQPAEECNIALRANCQEGKFLSPNSVREIGTAVSKLSECGLLHMVNVEDVQNFFKMQHEILGRSEGEFPYDIVEIGLKFLAAPDMSITLYNDEHINLIINRLAMLCEKMFAHSGEGDALHRLLPLFRSLAHVVEQCALDDQLLIKLCAMGIEAYFLEKASPSLQTAACSMLTAVFRRYTAFRDYMIQEIFMVIPKKRGSEKTILAAKGRRMKISSPARLFLELVQSVSSFPCDTEEYTKDVVRDIFARFSAVAMGSIAQSKLFERFCSDVAAVVAHPFYPVAYTFLKTMLELQLPLVSQREKLSKLAISSVSNALCLVTAIGKQYQESTDLKVPERILRFLGDFTEDDIKEYISMEGSHLGDFRDGMLTIHVDPTFPSNKFEKLLSHQVICMYLKQSSKLSDVLDTATSFHICQWSQSVLSEQEMNNMLVWWRGLIPETLDFEWTIDTAELLYINQLGKEKLFSNSYALVNALFSAINESSSAGLRSTILKGVGGLIKNDPNLLFHPKLVEHLKNAFKDKSPQVREAVLSLVASYIGQNEKMKSPYFHVVANCILDPAPLVVRTAVNTVGDLARNADDSELSTLCRILSFKLDDPVDRVRVMARSAFVTSIFEYAKSPLEVLLNVMARENERPAWFQALFKDEYAAHSSQLKSLFVELIESVCEEPSFTKTALLREFCELFPSAFVDHCDKLIAFYNTCDDFALITNISYSLIPVVKRMTLPNSTLLGLMVNKMKGDVCKYGTLIIRAVIELFANVVNMFLPECKVLDSLQSAFVDYLRKNLTTLGELERMEASASKDQNIGMICRALYGTGCIYRFYGAKNAKFSTAIWGPVNHYFKSKIPRIREMVMSCACDICVRDSSLIDKARTLVETAFKMGPPDSIAALSFICDLTEQETEESNTTTALDEIRPLYSTNLLQRFGDEIVACFYVNDDNIRTQTLKLIRTSLSYGTINPLNYIQHVIAMVCTERHSDLACKTITEAVQRMNGIDQVRNRLSDGIKQAYQLVRVAHPNGIKGVPISDPAFKLNALYACVPELLQKNMLECIFSKVNDALSSKGDPDWVLWLLLTLVNFDFTIMKEPAFVVSQLNSGTTSRDLRTAYSDAKKMLAYLGSIKLGKTPPRISVTTGASSWYAATVLLKAKKWITSRYQINPLKIDKVIGSKKPVKLADIDDIDLSTVPQPERDDPELSDGLFDMLTQLLSAMRMERSIDNKREATA